MLRELTIGILKEIQKKYSLENRELSAIEQSISYLEELPKRRKEVKRWKQKYLDIKRDTEWVDTNKKLPPKGEWVLVTTGEYQKTIEVMCYQGIRIGKTDRGNGWEDYKFHSWTSGHGDVMGYNPEYWMKLPNVPKESIE